MGVEEVGLLTLQALNLHVTIETTNDYLDALSWSFQDLLSNKSSSTETWTVLPEGTSVVLRTPDTEVHVGRVDPASVVRAVVTQLNSSARRSVDAPLHLHCGAVSIEAGCVVLLGHSGVGKSTLTAALIANGAAYVSDESVAVMANPPLINGFPKPISLKQGSRETTLPRLASAPTDDNWQVPATAIGVLAETPVTPRVLVFYQFDAQLGATAELEPVERADALLELLERSLDFSGRSETGFACASALVSQSTCVRLRAGSTQAACDVLLDPNFCFLEPSDATPVPAITSVSKHPTRATTTRSVELDGRVVILDTRSDDLGIHEVITLDHSGSVWWQLLDGSDPQENLAEMASVLELDPSDLEVGLTKLVDQLSDLGLLDVALLGDSQPGPGN